MSKDSTVWFFGKPYFWRKKNGVLTLVADRYLMRYFPRGTAADSAKSWAQVEHKFTRDLPAGKSALAAQASLYARLLAPTCVRCGNPAPPYESIEIDPLCSSCLIQLSYSQMWHEIDSKQ